MRSKLILLLDRNHVTTRLNLLRHTRIPIYLKKFNSTIYNNTVVNLLCLTITILKVWVVGRYLHYENHGAWNSLSSAIVQVSQLQRKRWSLDVSTWFCLLAFLNYFNFGIVFSHDIQFLDYCEKRLGGLHWANGVSNPP